MRVFAESAGIWAVLTLGLLAMALALWKGLTSRNPRGLPLSVVAPITATLTISLAAAAPLGLIPLTIGLIALNLAWVTIVVRSWSERPEQPQA